MDTPITYPPEGSPSDDPFSLDDLLAESYQERQEVKEAKAGRLLLAKGKLPKAATKELQQKVLEAETKEEWASEADVLAFDLQKCQSCGHTHSHYVGRFQKQRHRDKKLTRFVRMSTLKGEPLVKIVDRTVSNVPICSECCGDIGFNFDGRLP